MQMIITHGAAISFSGHKTLMVIDNTNCMLKKTTHVLHGPQFHPGHQSNKSSNSDLVTPHHADIFPSELTA